MPQPRVQIEGLADFRRRLRALDTNLPKGMRLVMNETSQMVIDYAMPMIPVRTGRARKSIRAASTQTSARVRAGSARAPYYPWLDFGGRVGKNRSVTRQFRRNGRYLYIAYYRLRDNGNFERALMQGLRRIADSAGIPFREP